MTGSYLCPFPVRVFTAVNCAWSKFKSPSKDFLVGKMISPRIEPPLKKPSHFQIKVAANHTNADVIQNNKT